MVTTPLAPPQSPTVLGTPGTVPHPSVPNGGDLGTLPLDEGFMKAEESPAVTHLLVALDALYPLPDDARRSERVAQTCVAVQRFMAESANELAGVVLEQLRGHVTLMRELADSDLTVRELKA